MRKQIILLVLILFSSMSIHAFTPLKDDQGNYMGKETFELFAYYQGQNSTDRKVSISITDNSYTAIYHAGTITETITNPTDETLEFKPIFRWVLSGSGFNPDSQCPINVEFDFKALMAYVQGNDTYYIPEHHYTLDMGDDPPLSASQESDLLNNPFPTGSGNYQYPEYSEQHININRKLYLEGAMNADSKGTWQVEGSFDLYITKYSKLVGVAFDYSAEVKVVFSIQ